MSSLFRSILNQLPDYLSNQHNKVELIQNTKEIYYQAATTSKINSLIQEGIFYNFRERNEADHLLVYIS
jgi:hypothetical protein